MPPEQRGAAALVVVGVAATALAATFGFDALRRDHLAAKTWQNQMNLCIEHKSSVTCSRRRRRRQVAWL